MRGLRTGIPVYVTRPFGPTSERGRLTAPAWMPLLSMLLFFANIIGWGIYGLVVLVEKVVG